MNRKLICTIAQDDLDDLEFGDIHVSQIGDIFVKPRFNDMISIQQKDNCVIIDPSTVEEFIEALYMIMESD